MGIVKCSHAHIWGAFWQCKVFPCPYMGGFLTVQSVPMPIYGGLFGSAKCSHAHIWGAFWQCKVSPCPYMGGFLAVQSVPMPIYGGLFGSAKCPHARIWGPAWQCKVSPCPHIWGAFWQCKVSPCPHIGACLAVQSVPTLPNSPPMLEIVALQTAAGGWTSSAVRCRFASLCICHSWLPQDVSDAELELLVPRVLKYLALCGVVGLERWTACTPPVNIKKFTPLGKRRRWLSGGSAGRWCNATRESRQGL